MKTGWDSKNTIK